MSLGPHTPVGGNPKDVLGNPKTESVPSDVSLGINFPFSFGTWGFAEQRIVVVATESVYDLFWASRV